MAKELIPGALCNSHYYSGEGKKFVYRKQKDNWIVYFHNSVRESDKEIPTYRVYFSKPNGPEIMLYDHPDRMPQHLCGSVLRSDCSFVVDWNSLSCEDQKRFFSQKKGFCDRLIRYDFLVQLFVNNGEVGETNLISKNKYAVEFSRYLLGLRGDLPRDYLLLMLQQ